MGAWIEIIFGAELEAAKPCRPRMGAWIEIVAVKRLVILM